MDVAVEGGAKEDLLRVCIDLEEVHSAGAGSFRYLLDRRDTTHRRRRPLPTSEMK